VDPFFLDIPTLCPDTGSVVGKLEHVLDTIAEIEDKDGITEESELYEILQEKEYVLRWLESL
jgi:hypothetical protein